MRVEWRELGFLVCTVLWHAQKFSCALAFLAIIADWCMTSLTTRVCIFQSQDRVCMYQGCLACPLRLTLFHICVAWPRRFLRVIRPLFSEDDWEMLQARLMKFKATSPVQRRFNYSFECCVRWWMWIEIFAAWEFKLSNRRSMSESCLVRWVADVKVRKIVLSPHKISVVLWRSGFFL